MTYAIDRTLNLCLAPCMLRAVDLVEMTIIASDPGPYYNKLGAMKGLQVDLTFDEWQRQILKLSTSQTFMTAEDFIDHAERIALDRLARREEIQRDKFAKKQRDLALFPTTVTVDPAGVAAAA